MDALPISRAASPPGRSSLRGRMGIAARGGILPGVPWRGLASAARGEPLP
jgi:hypothetical protein